MKIKTPNLRRARDTFLAVGGAFGILAGLLTKLKEMPPEKSKEYEGELKMQLKNVSEQTIIITGASSGIGLTTARAAAKRGARLVLAARSEDALRELADEINAGGGAAIYVVADVGREEDVRRIAQAATEKFGGFDTWVNDAGVGIFGKLEDIDLESMRRLFDTDFWGIVHGSLEAAKTLKRRGGAIINLGSVVSDRVVYLQGIYSASKHAVKGFTDALRMELEADGAPVSVTLVQPASINTPFSINSKNYMDKEFTLPPPVYAPDVVAETILHCAENRVRNVFVGGGGKALSAMEKYAPALTDKIMANEIFADSQKKNEPARPLSENGLDRPSERLQERGDYEGHTMESSLYTKASLHPALTLAAVVGVGLGVAALLVRAANGAPKDGQGNGRLTAGRQNENSFKKINNYER